jgi:predicted short-subunit dehydrogenase-like oxidoreductase (DUF2520 family)
MPARFPVVLVGAGRLGGYLAPRLVEAGFPVTVVRRGERIPPAGLTWFVVPDDTLPARVRDAPPGLRLHSAGALGPEVLGDAGAVLHPLMSFPPPPGAPVFATRTGAGEAAERAGELAAVLGWTVLGPVSDPSRYHAAAAMASGHAAALFLDAVRLLAAATGATEASAAEALLALAGASLRNVAEGGPLRITGPAARGDLATIARHRAALPPELLPAYDALTERIRALRGV